MVDPIAFLTLPQNRKTSTINVWTMIEHGEYITEVWSALYFGGLYMVVSILNVFEPYFFFQKETTSEVSKAWGHMESTWSHGLQSVIVCFQILRFFIINQLWIVSCYQEPFLSLLSICSQFLSQHEAFISHDQPFWTNGEPMVILGTNHWLTAGCTATGAKSLSLPCRPGKMGISWRPWCKLQN